LAPTRVYLKAIKGNLYFVATSYVVHEFASLVNFISFLL